uniref:Uncharacterized protein n=1 Tax=Arundo donax TaxID=35708 RepID=A0A0A9B4I3_ARUDO
MRQIIIFSYKFVSKDIKLEESRKRYIVENAKCIPKASP